MVRPVSAARRWNTWNAATPAAVSDIGTGLQLRVLTYSGRHARVVNYDGRRGVTLGEHGLGGDPIRMELDVEGSRFSLELAKPSAATVVGRLRLLHAGELRLRLWTLLALEVDPAAGPGDGVALDPAPVRPSLPGAAPAILTATARSEHLAVATDPEASVCGGYSTVQDLVDEMLEEGYLPPDRAQPPSPGVIVARFNHEATSVVHFAAALALDPERARSSAADACGRADQLVAASRERLEILPPDEPDREVAGRSDAGMAEDAEAAAAIRDVLAWNTTYDPAHHRAYTGLSRNWTAHKFGGWLVWQTDVLYNALLAASLGDAELTAANLDAVLNAAQPAGNLPCLVSGRTEWGDRSHPPIAAWVVATCAARLGDSSLVPRHLDTLLAAHAWWDRHRTFADSLLAYGSSATGRGLYARTALAGRNESSMDNSPMFDDVPLIAGTEVLDLGEVGLNALHVLSGEILAAAAKAEGRDTEAEALRAGAQRRGRAVADRLWDGQRKTFAGRRSDGTFARCISPTSFLPLLAGIADNDQIEGMLHQIRDVHGFAAETGVPAHRLDDPATADDSYWRGRVWPPFHLLTYQALHRVGARELAAETARRGWNAFASQWRRDRLALEHLHPDLDGPHLGPDVDTFYSWSALMPYALRCEAGDVTVHEGLRLGPASGVVVAEGRRWVVRTDSAAREISIDLPTGERIDVNGAQYVTHVRADRRPPTGGVRVVGVDVPIGTRRVSFAAPGEVPLGVAVDGRRAEPVLDDHGVRVSLDGTAAHRVEVVFP